VDATVEKAPPKRQKQHGPLTSLLIQPKMTDEFKNIDFTTPISTFLNSCIVEFSEVVNQDVKCDAMICSPQFIPECNWYKNTIVFVPVKDIGDYSQVLDTMNTKHQLELKMLFVITHSEKKGKKAQVFAPNAPLNVTVTVFVFGSRGYSLPYVQEHDQQNHIHSACSYVDIGIGKIKGSYFFPYSH